MKRKTSCLLIIILFLSTFTFAQEQYKTEVIDGIEYYVYSVKQSEGLYRISVNFGVSQDEIIKINPEAKNTLKVGQILFIPKKQGFTPVNTVAASQQQTTTTSVPKTTAPTQTQQQKTPPSADIIAATLGGKTDTPLAAKVKKEENPENFKKIELKNSEPHFYYHKVEKKQTLYSLSRQYGVMQEDIIKYNPQAATVLREGEVLRIPKPEDIYVEKKAEKMQEDLSVKYMIHKVEAGETLYAISKKYNVEQDDIRKLNSGLEILSIGQELKIPYYTALLTTDTKDGKTRTYLDWDKVLKDDDEVAKTPELRIAFLLPFMLSNRNDANIARFVDFYGGAVKAIAEAKEKGISINIYAFDTGTSEEKMKEIFAKNPVLKEMDLIVGPAYSAQVPIATHFAKQHKVKTLIPFTSKVADIENNSYVFQFNPGMDTELSFLSQLFKTKLNDMHYIFADIEYVPATDEGAIISGNIKKMLDEQGKKYQTLLISDPAINQFDSAVVYSKKNLFIFNTDQFQVVQPYLENLNLTDRKYDITLLERYNWKNQNVYRPIGVYVAPFRPEYDMANLSEYNKEFVNLQAWEPAVFSPRYDILGYDLLNYFIEILNNDEKNMMEMLELGNYWQGVQSQFNFKRESLNAGFINQQLYVGDSQVR